MGKPPLVVGKPRLETPNPVGVKGSYGPKVISWSKTNLGLTFGKWQAHVITQALRYDKNGDLIHRQALISTGRQNGKSIIVRSLIGWMLAEGKSLPPFARWSQMICAAHDAQQARLVYHGIYQDLLSDPALAGKMRRLTRYHGIEASNGLELKYVSSQAGSSRGISAGLIAWDEVLTQTDYELYESLTPSQSAQRSPLMILTSTAGHANSVVLRAFYDRLKRQASGDEEYDPSFYGAWWQSDSPDAGLDWDQIAQANPALGDGRLTKSFIQSEFATLPNDSWRRERLNHFTETQAAGAFKWDKWDSCRVPDPLLGLSGPFALAVDVVPDWRAATIAVAGQRPDGRIGVAILKSLEDSPRNPLTPARVIAEIEAFPSPFVIVYDGVSAIAPALDAHHIATGLPYDKLLPRAVISACMDFSRQVLSGNLAVNDKLLDEQIPNLAKKDLGKEGAFRFVRGLSTGNVDAVMAATFAVHAVAYKPSYPSILGAP